MNASSAPRGKLGRWLFKTFAAAIGIAALSTASSLYFSAHHAGRPYALDDLYVINARDASGKPANITVADITQWRTALREHAQLAWYDAAFADRDMFYDIGGLAVVARSVTVSENFLDILRVDVREGRNDAGYLLAHDFRLSRFGSERIAGAAVRKEAHDAGLLPHVVGVLPEGCCVPELRELMFVESEPQLRRPVKAVVRYTGTGGLPALEARMSASLQNHAAQSLEFVPLRRLVLGPGATMVRALLLIGVVAFVVCIVSVAQTDSAGDLASPADWTLRTVLGASRLRIVREVLTRLAACVLPAFVLSLPIARAGVDAAVEISGPGQLPLPGLPVVALVAIGSGIAVLAFVLLAVIELPLVLRLSRSVAIQRAERASAWQRRLAVGMAACQIALGVTAAYGSALLARTMMAVSAFDSDVRTEGVYAASVTQPLLKDLHEVRHYPQPRFARISEELLRTLSDRGDLAAGIVIPMPFTRSPAALPWMRLTGPQREAPNRIARISPEMADGRAIKMLVTPGVLDVLGLRVVEGRTWQGEEHFRPRSLLDDRTQPRPPAPVLVSASLAAKAWPGRSGVGQYLKLDLTQYGSLRVLGTVDDAHLFGADSVLDTVYMPFEWEPWQHMTVVASGPSGGNVIAALREAVAATGGYAALGGVEPLTAVRARHRRLQQQLLMVFSIAAIACVVIAAGSVYAAVAFQLESRRQETAVRMALGAGRGRLTRIVAGYAVPMLLIGFSLGAVLSRLVDTELGAFFYGLESAPAYMLAGTFAAFLGIATAATLPHVMSAFRMDPANLLRFGRLR